MLKFFMTLPQKLYATLAGVLFLVVTIFTFGKFKENEGKNKVENKNLRNEEEKRVKGREAAFKEKRNVAGVSDSDLVDRLRSRGDDWGSL